MSAEGEPMVGVPGAHTAEGEPMVGVPGAHTAGGEPMVGVPGSHAAEGGGPLMGLEIFEVFRQEKEGGPMVHGGSLLAPDGELAAHYAREFYGRRQESVRLWVVKRSAIHDVTDPDLLQPPMDRSFKKPVGYSAGIKQKLAEARERAGGQE